MGKPNKDEELKEFKKIKIDVTYLISNILLAILPTMWFSWLYPSCKFSLGKWGIVTNIVIISISLFFVIVTSCRGATKKEVIIERLQTKYEDEASEHKRTKKSLKGIVASTTLKQNILHKYIQEMYNSKDFTKAPYIITQPLNQLNHIIENIYNSVCDLTGLNNKKVTIAAAIKCSCQNIHDWIWMESFTPNSSDNLDKLSQIPSSTFYKVIRDNGKHYICYNSKKEAFKKQEYFEDVPVEYIDDGIIIARHYFVKGNSGYNWVEIVLFITTKSNIFIDDYEKNDIKNLLNSLIFEEYRYRIEIELMLYVIEKLYKNNHPELPNNTDKTP